MAITTRMLVDAIEQMPEEYRVFAEADADALGMSPEEYAVMVFREGLQLLMAGELDLFDMSPLSQAGDRQWKSH